MVSLQAIGPWAALRQPPWRFLFSSWPWRSLLYTVISVVLSAALVVVVVSLVIFFFLLPFLPLIGIQLGKLERRRIAIMGYPFAPSGHVRIRWRDRRQWLRVRIAEQSTWRELASLFIGVLFGLLEFAVVAAGVLVLSVFAIGLWWIIFQFPTFDRYPLHFVLPDGRSEWVTSRGSDFVPIFLAGGIIAIFVMIALIYLGTIVTAAHASATRALLLPRQKELQKQVARLKMSRINLMEAFELERRRIERDLHDGVQQRLVALSMTLGIAELEIEQVARQSAPVGALREAVSAAHNQAEAALADLRNTVRGIHPHVLADFGLAEAIREISGRLPLNSAVTVAFDQRLPEQVELCAYFFVSEALTNAVRHSGASAVRVTASLVNDELVVEVRDNGKGGAELGRGSGLVGLRDRAEALNGHLSVESPRGGPTSLWLAVPFLAPNGRE